jgi:hypothetical protein
VLKKHVLMLQMFLKKVILHLFVKIGNQVAYQIIQIPVVKINQQLVQNKQLQHVLYRQKDFVMLLIINAH